MTVESWERSSFMSVLICLYPEQSLSHPQVSCEEETTHEVPNLGDGVDLAGETLEVSLRVPQRVLEHPESTILPL